MKPSSIFFLLSFTLLFFSCTKEEIIEEEKNTHKIPFSGVYSWKFTIPGIGSQTSTHTFYPDSILYKMEGFVYNTSYTQVLHSYEPDSLKLITIGKGGSISKSNVYFVMFFKDVTDTSVTIYKHECVNGETEAENFKRPADNATADYGWNVYIKTN